MPKTDNQALRLKKEIAKYMGLLYEHGLTSSLGGNISIRAGEVVYVSPTKIPSYRIRPADVSVVTLDGKCIEGKPASSELPTHLVIYRRTGQSAIVHAHSRFATAFSCLGRDLASPDVEGKHLLGNVPLIPFREPGTSSLGDAVARGISGHNGALLQNHGLIAVGNTLEQAFIIAEEIERAAQLTFDMYVLSHP